MARWMANPATRARSGSSVVIVPSISGRSSRVRPVSWAAIITAVSPVVATSPNTAQPVQSISGLSHRFAGVQANTAVAVRRLQPGGQHVAADRLGHPTQQAMVHAAHEVPLLVH